MATYARHDFNNDIISDVLWRNTRTSEVGIWTVKGNALESTSLGLVPLDWNIVTTGDINGDRTTDIIWQNTISGQINTWLIRDTKILSNLEIRNPGKEWLPVDANWFGVDTNQDLLLQN